MKKLIINLSVCALIAAVAISSCKKKDEPSTKDKITGTWRERQYIADANGNGQPDDYIQNLDSFQNTITFASNGSGYYNVAGVRTLDFNWSVNGNFLILSADTSSGSKRLIFTSASAMTLEDTSLNTTFWSYYTK